jgi:DNA polymerase III gamma/tau subunit
LKRQAALFSESDLVRFFHSLSETETKLRAATQPRYQLEVGIVKLMELRGVESIGEILQRLAALESGAGSASPVKSPAAQTLPTPETPIERIKSVLQSQKKMLLVTALDAAQASVLENGELNVQFAADSRYQHDKLSESTRVLAEVCREVTGQETRIRIEIKDSGSPRKEDEQQLLRDRAESSPAVKQALKTFRGEIIDVRRSN